MNVWIDAQLPPSLAGWLTATFGVDAQAVRSLGLLRASDSEIYRAAMQPGVVVMTKDIDFLPLLEQFGPPPQVIWITCGNTSNARLKTVLLQALPPTIDLLASGAPLVEISDHR